MALTSLVSAVLHNKKEGKASLGYPFPVAYGVIQGIELFAEYLGKSTQETLDWRIARLNRLGPKLEECVKTYAKRHYDLEVGFDGAGRYV